MKILGIIPARGGSKGIPRKNIIEIGGKPLIAYTIEAARKAMEAGCIDELMVSTDDEEIAAVAQKYGARVPYLRPEALSGDTAKSVDLMIHAYEYYVNCGIEYDAIILLQPTSPLRLAEDIIGAINLFISEKTTSLISCYREEHLSELGFYHKQDNLALPYNENHNKGMRRQDIEDLYIRNGAIYITTAEQMMKNHCVFDDVPAMYEMPKSRSTDLDTMDDLYIIEQKLRDRDD